MNKILLFLVLLFNTPNLFGAYQIKLAVYKDKANLKANISKVIGNSYKKNILIKEKNHLYYVTSFLYDNKAEVKKALNAYKKVFSDAFIIEVKQEKAVVLPSIAIKKKVEVPVSAKAVAKAPDVVEEINQTRLPLEVMVKTPQQPVEHEQPTALDTFIVEGIQNKEALESTEVAKKEAVIPVSTEAVAKTPEPIKNESLPVLNAKMLLENKTVYICDEDGAKKAKKEVVKMDFKQDYVVYRKLNRDIPPIHIAYTFEEDRVILPMSGINFKYQIYHEGQDFLSAQSFIEDKKGHKLRCYFDEELALEFARH